jgi:hypothetical protein
MLRSRRLAKRFRVGPCAKRQRRGASTLDYILTMGVSLPLMGILYVAGPKIMNLVNQMTTVLVSWPFM